MRVIECGRVCALDDTLRLDLENTPATTSAAVAADSNTNRKQIQSRVAAVAAVRVMTFGRA